MLFKLIIFDEFDNIRHLRFCKYQFKHWVFDSLHRVVYLQKKRKTGKLKRPKSAPIATGAGANEIR